MLQEIRYSHAAVFCKSDIRKTSQFSWKSICDGVPFGKTVTPHVCNYTKKDAIAGVFLCIAFVNIIFFWFISLKHSLGHALQSSYSQKFRKAYRKPPALKFFLLDKVA